MVSESFTLVRARDLAKVGAGGGVEMKYYDEPPKIRVMRLSRNMRAIG